jgi:hypothetical protein
VVVFVCRDAQRARAAAERADALLCAARAYPGEHPSGWEYPARRGMLFAAERDVHEGKLDAWCLPALPPALRASCGEDSPGTGEDVLHITRIPTAGEPGLA